MIDIAAAARAAWQALSDEKKANLLRMLPAGDRRRALLSKEETNR